MQGSMSRVEKVAAKLGISAHQVFVRGHHGYFGHSNGTKVSKDYSRWQRDGIAPDYVVWFCRRHQ